MILVWRARFEAYAVCLYSGPAEHALELTQPSRRTAVER